MSVSVSTASSSRVDTLARPKGLPPAFFEDRRSVYWVDHRPLQSNGHTAFALTPRLAELSQNKGLSSQYIADRPTPEWIVSESAKNVMSSARVSALAQHKVVHPDFMPYRSLEYQPSSAERSPPPENPYLVTLAQPKPHKMWHNKDVKYVELGEFCRTIWPVDSNVFSKRCPSRVDLLSGHKEPHQNYRGERPVRWPVSDNAKNSTATLRLQQLARPKSGRLRGDDYDPYKVTPAARLARPTPRVTELSTPIPRKVRHKVN